MKVKNNIIYITLLLITLLVFLLINIFVDSNIVRLININMLIPLIVVLPLVVFIIIIYNLANGNIDLNKSVVSCLIITGILITLQLILITGYLSYLIMFNIKVS